MSSVSSKTTSGSATASDNPGNDKDSNLPMEVMADSFIGLLVDLFTMLPVEGRQELFTTLYKVYPKPVDVKQILKIGHCQFETWQQDLLDTASTLSQLCSFTLFPKQLPSMEDFESQLQKAIRDHGYGSRAYHRARAKLKKQSDDKRTGFLQLCHTRFCVSSSHISFLEQLYKRLQKAGGSFQFQMQLLLAQVSNCTVSDWTHSKHSCEDQCLLNHFLASKDFGASLQALQDMWQFSITPECVLQLLETVHDQATPQLSDIMCDILISVLDCKESLHLRIIMLLRAIGAKPEPILQAVNAVSCSNYGNCQSPKKCRTAVIQCVEALGKSYSMHKTAEESLLKLKTKAVDLLQHVRNSTATCFTHTSDSAVHIQSVMEIVCASGQQTLTDYLTLVVMNPGKCLLPTLKGMDELCNYCHRNTSSDQSRPLQLPPFKKTVTCLLERRKSYIKEMAASNRETAKLRNFLADLKASLYFLGIEEDFTTFEQDLASVSQDANRHKHVQRDRQPLMQSLDAVHGAYVTTRVRNRRKRFS